MSGSAQLPCISKVRAAIGGYDQPQIKSACLVSQDDEKLWKSEIKAEFQTQLSAGLTNLLKERLLIDVEVVVDSKSFPCHSVVLASFSNYFRAALTSSWTESTNRKITISHEDVTRDSFQQILDLIYTQDVTLSLENVKAMLKTAIYLDIKLIKNICIRELEKGILPETCLGLWSFAEKYELKGLVQAASATAVRDFENVIYHREFLGLPKARVLTFVSKMCSVFGVEKNESLCRGILLWVDKDMHPRSEFLEELLPFVNFPLLPPRYLNELRIKWDHRHHQMKERISEAITYHLEGVVAEDKSVKRKILSRQCSISPKSDLCKSVILMGGCCISNTFSQTLKAFPVSDEKLYIMHNLGAVPWINENLGFAACMWRNDIFISGGLAKPTCFTAYSPGTGEWQTLTSLPHGRIYHTMAAVNSSIFILGGIKLTSKDAQHKPYAEVLMYNLETKAWRIFGYLKMPVEQTTSGVLGHRIYIFGGKNEKDESTDLVQCVDTTSYTVYVCGCLPRPTYGAQAVSNGGTIFVVTRKGDLMEMMEDFERADKIEAYDSGHDVSNDKNLPLPGDRQACKPNEPNPTDSASGSACTSGETSADIQAKADKIPEVVESDEKDKDEMSPREESTCSLSSPLSSLEEYVEEEEEEERTSSTVSFSPIGKFPPRNCFGAYIHGNEIVLCGGRDADGNLLHDMVKIEIPSGKAFPMERTIFCGMDHIAAFVVNIPKDFLKEEEKYTPAVYRLLFTPDKLPCSTQLSINNVNWKLCLSRKDEDSSVHAELLQASNQRQYYDKGLKVCFSCRLVAKKMKAFEKREHTFSKTGGGRCTLRLISTEELMARDSPYLYGGKALLEFSISAQEVFVFGF